MTRPAASPAMALSRFGWRDLGLWAGAAALVLGAHVAVAYVLQSLSPIETDGGPPPAAVIEMAPMVITPAVPEQAAILDAAISDPAEPTPKTEPDPQEQVDRAEPVVERSEATPPADAEPIQAEMAERVDETPPDEIIPDIVEAVAPDLVIPLPQPKPVEAPKEKKPVEAKAKKPVERPKPRPKKAKAEPAKTVATPSAETEPAAKAAAPKSAAGVSGTSPAKWESRLTAWINRHKRYPGTAKSRRSQGNTNVVFTVDASGQVISARVVRSSGDPELDRAALAVLQGATVPAPPAELGPRVSRTAPFVFSLRD
ncbi:TonB family protein [Mesorhizobium sp. B2-3-3]|nr:TonB family protein [Mesorhizobium sp. B2-3-3]